MRSIREQVSTGIPVISQEQPHYPVSVIPSQYLSSLPQSGMYSSALGTSVIQVPVNVPDYQVQAMGTGNISLAHPEVLEDTSRRSSVQYHLQQQLIDSLPESRDTSPAVEPTQVVPNFIQHESQIAGNEAVIPTSVFTYQAPDKQPLDLVVQGQMSAAKAHPKHPPHLVDAEESVSSQSMHIKRSHSLKLKPKTLKDEQARAGASSTPAESTTRTSGRRHATVHGYPVMHHPQTSEALQQSTTLTSETPTSSVQVFPYQNQPHHQIQSVAVPHSPQPVIKQPLLEQGQQHLSGLQMFPGLMLAPQQQFQQQKAVHELQPLQPQGLPGQQNPQPATLTALQHQLQLQLKGKDVITQQQQAASRMIPAQVQASHPSGLSMYQPQPLLTSQSGLGIPAYNPASQQLLPPYPQNLGLSPLVPGSQQLAYGLDQQASGLGMVLHPQQGPVAQLIQPHQQPHHVDMQQPHSSGGSHS